MILLTKNMFTCSKACKKKTIIQISRENGKSNAYSTLIIHLQINNNNNKSPIFHIQEKKT